MLGKGWDRESQGIPGIPGIPGIAAHTGTEVTQLPRGLDLCRAHTRSEHPHKCSGWGGHCLGGTQGHPIGPKGCCKSQENSAHTVPPPAA